MLLDALKVAVRPSGVCLTDIVSTSIGNRPPKLALRGRELLREDRVSPDMQRPDRTEQLRSDGSGAAGY